jgi:hypothetical protein
MLVKVGYASIDVIGSTGTSREVEFTIAPLR